MVTVTSEDRRKGWIVVFAMFLVLAVGITARNSIGLMMPTWRTELGWSYGYVSSVAAVMMTVMALAAPIAGLAFDRFGPSGVFAVAITLVAAALGLCAVMTENWHLMVLFGLVAGLGFAVISPSLVSTTVVRYFDANIGLATSVATSGSTGGQLALMPLLGLMLLEIGWRLSYVALSIAMIVLMVMLLYILRNAPAKPRAATSAGSQTLRATLPRLASDKTFWLLATGFFICGFTTVGVIKIHLIPYAVACGFPQLQSATAYGVLSLFSMIGMIAYGHFSDRLHRPMLLASIYFMRAMTFILLMHIAGNLPALYIFAVLFGIFDYATFPIVASLVATHLGRNIMGLSMGLIFAAHSLGGALGSFMGGYLFDLYARYDWVWIISVILAATAGFLSLMISETRRDARAPVTA